MNSIKNRITVKSTKDISITKNEQKGQQVYFIMDLLPFIFQKTMLKQVGNFDFEST